MNCFREKMLPVKWRLNIVLFDTWFAVLLEYGSVKDDIFHIGQLIFKCLGVHANRNISMHKHTTRCNCQLILFLQAQICKHLQIINSVVCGNNEAILYWLIDFNYHNLCNSLKILFHFKTCYTNSFEIVITTFMNGLTLK